MPQKTPVKYTRQRSARAGRNNHPRHHGEKGNRRGNEATSAQGSRPAPSRHLVLLRRLGVGVGMRKGEPRERRCFSPAGLRPGLGNAPAMTQPLVKCVGSGRLSQMPAAVRWAPCHPPWGVLAGATGGQVETPQAGSAGRVGAELEDPWRGWQDSTHTGWGARHCQGPLGLGLLVSDAWEAFFTHLTFPATCLGTAIVQMRKLRNRESVITPRPTGYQGGLSVTPLSWPCPSSPPRRPSLGRSTLPPKAGRGSNDKHLHLGSGFSVPAVPRTSLRLILQLPGTLGSTSSPFYRCKKLAQPLAHLARCREEAQCG